MGLIISTAVYSTANAAADTPDQNARDEGLVAVKVKGLDKVYARLDPDLSG